ncbi:hypothetical protein DFQ28_011630 [Apophysomyces sp. BC1034]|nr:hypothetical protein DFQ30_000125 [Apophysomyces sp. BC1015]KAG0168699.1 hypothetical protein DFQ29_010053 [Apophysomyces sp. BC1021]KAG0184181.1 hypothetical protein DFQ28_011630 [Apophysomyces sp. BC1034]
MVAVAYVKYAVTFPKSLDDLFQSQHTAMSAIKATYAFNSETKTFQSAFQGADVTTAITAIQKDINQYLTERIIANEGSNNINEEQNDEEDEDDEEDGEEDSTDSQTRKLENQENQSTKKQKTA